MKPRSFTPNAGCISGRVCEIPRHCGKCYIDQMSRFIRVDQHVWVTKNNDMTSAIGDRPSNNDQMMNDLWLRQVTAFYSRRHTLSVEEAFSMRRETSVSSSYITQFPLENSKYFLIKMLILFKLYNCHEIVVPGNYLIMRFH